jgi:hypothetical protein
MHVASNEVGRGCAPFIQSKMYRRTKGNRKLNPTTKSPPNIMVRCSDSGCGDARSRISASRVTTSESPVQLFRIRRDPLLPACSSLEVKGFGPFTWRDAMKRELLGAEGVSAADSRLRASRDSRRACRAMAASRVPVLAIGAHSPISGFCAADFRISHTYFCIFPASLAAWTDARGNLLFEEGLVLQVLRKLSLECDSDCASDEDELDDRAVVGACESIRESLRFLTSRASLDSRAEPMACIDSASVPMLDRPASLLLRSLSAPCLSSPQVRRTSIKSPYDDSGVACHPSYNELELFTASHWRCDTSTWCAAAAPTVTVCDVYPSYPGTRRKRTGAEGLISLRLSPAPEFGTRMGSAGRGIQGDVTATDCRERCGCYR